MNTSLTMYRPGLLGRTTFDDVFDNIFHGAGNFDSLLRKSTQGYPVADIYRDETGQTVMEFALAGFSKENLSVEVKPEDKSITVRAETNEGDEEESSRRIARRSFQKTYINYDNNLDLSESVASYENGLLRIIVPTRPEAQPLTVKIS